MLFAAQKTSKKLHKGNDIYASQILIGRNVPNVRTRSILIINKTIVNTN